MAGRETAAMPRGRRGLSPAARAVAVTLAARTPSFAEPLLRRRTAGAGMASIVWTPRLPTVSLALVERWQAGSSLSADLLQRHSFTSSLRGRGAGAVSGHRALYNLLLRLGPRRAWPSGIDGWPEDSWTAP